MLPPKGVEELGLDSAGSREVNVTGFRTPQQFDRLTVQILGQISFDRNAGVQDQRRQRIGAAARLGQTRVSRSWRTISVESGNL